MARAADARVHSVLQALAQSAFATELSLLPIMLQLRFQGDL